MRLYLAALFTTVLAAPVHAQWRMQTSGTTASLRGLSVVDAQTVWASGSRGTILRTVNGGNTWQSAAPANADSLDFRSIHGRSALVAHAAATAGRIYRTTDGGVTWSLRFQAADTSVFLDAIDFWDDRHGVALGDPMQGRFLLLVTRDGGETWTEAPMDSRPITVDGEAAFAASGSSLIVDGMRGVWIGSGGKAAHLFRSADRGTTWTTIDVPIRQGGATEGIFSVALAGKSLMIVGGNYTQNDSARANAALYVPGRKAWTPIASVPRGFRSGVAAGRGGKMLIAVGPGGSDTSDDGGITWRPFDSTGFHAIRASANSVFFATGSEGRIGVYHGSGR